MSESNNIIGNTAQSYEKIWFVGVISAIFLLYYCRIGLGVVVEGLGEGGFYLEA